MKDYLLIAREWEAFTMAHDGAIEGSLNAYRIQFTAQINGISYSALKKLENVKGGGGLTDLKPSPYSEKLSVHATIPLQEGCKLMLVKANLFNKLMLFLRGLKSEHFGSSWLVGSNAACGLSADTFNSITVLPGMRGMRIAENAFRMRLIALPGDEREIKIIHDTVQDVMRR
ncbi:MAG: hypothetical protein KDC12_06890 [Flavobacteriales bacterium]|nr:hypothetical protein [Flavobacteriales bacterium]